MTRPKAVLFDFDFTLADSSSGILQCVGFALRHLGFAVPPAAKTLGTIGLSLSETFRQLTGEKDPQYCSEFGRLFHEHADQVMDSRTVIYDCVRPVIRNLRESHLETGIVSSKLRYRIGNILRLNGLDTSFSVVVGADDVANGKPDPEGILLAIRKLGVDPESAMYVGDHCVDATAAKNAGVPFVATLSGTHSRQDFDPYPCRAIVSDLGDLPSVLSL